MYICHVFLAKAYINPDSILLVHEMMPMIASSNFNNWLNTPTEKRVPEILGFIIFLRTYNSFIQSILLTTLLGDRGSLML